MWNIQWCGGDTLTTARIYCYLYPSAVPYSRRLIYRLPLQVIAFAMKEFGWSLEQAYREVQSRRIVVKPNESFMEQLQTYEGILNARSATYLL